MKQHAQENLKLFFVVVAVTGELDILQSLINVCFIQLIKKATR
jgi:hypothetical protein